MKKEKPAPVKTSKESIKPVPKPGKDSLKQALAEKMDILFSNVMDS